MASLYQDVLSKYEADQYENVISVWSSSGLVPSLEPLCARIVAASLFKLGRFPEALALLENIESCFTDDSSFFSLIGATFRRLGEFQRAEYYLCIAKNLEPLSLPIQNNYANLLIDLKRFDEASVIFENILAKEPTYEDAQVNSLRLKDAQLKALSLQVDSEPEFRSSTDWNPSDPLLLAFSQEEVDRTISRIKPSISQSAKVLASNLPRIAPTDTLKDQIKLAHSSISDKNYSFALKICASICKSGNGKAMGDAYDIAADAYIGLNLFHQAEICFLTAANLRGYSFKYFFNLCTLSCMRGDSILASVYYKRAQELEPDSPNLSVLSDSIKSLDHSFYFPINWNNAAASQR